MAIVNRPAHGRPGHGDTDNGQDVAWLAAFKYAQKSVFMCVKMPRAWSSAAAHAARDSQTPTLNASPLIPAIISAVKRGLQVTLYVDVGFNDSVSGPSCLTAERVADKETGRGTAVPGRDERRGRKEGLRPARGKGEGEPEAVLVHWCGRPRHGLRSCAKSDTSCIQRRTRIVPSTRTSTRESAFSLKFTSSRLLCSFVLPPSAAMSRLCR